MSNAKYRDLIRSRFPTTDCILSEVVNQACAKFKTQRILMEPRYIFIEPTSTCNITCIMCPVPDNSRMTRKRKMLTADNLSAILDANPKLRVVYLTNWGEPMLNKQLTQLIETCSRRGLLTVMTSNATLLNADLTQAILKSGLGVARFSMDGIGEYYERVRSVSYQKVKSNIESFIAARNQGGYKTRVELNSTFMPENVESMESVNEEWESKVDFIHYQGVIAIPTITIQERIGKPSRRPECRQIYRSAFFLTNGSVVPCCADFNAELNLDDEGKSRNAFTILNSKSARDLRSRHAEGNLPDICSACTQYQTPLFTRNQSSII